MQKHLFWPESPKKKIARKSKVLIPSAISSEKWRQIIDEKEKQLKEEKLKKQQERKQKQADKIKAKAERGRGRGRGRGKGRGKLFKPVADTSSDSLPELSDSESDNIMSDEDNSEKTSLPLKQGTDQTAPKAKRRLNDFEIAIEPSNSEDQPSQHDLVESLNCKYCRKIMNAQDILKNLCSKNWVKCITCQEVTFRAYPRYTYHFIQT